MATAVLSISLVKKYGVDVRLASQLPNDLVDEEVRGPRVRAAYTSDVAPRTSNLQVSLHWWHAFRRHQHRKTHKFHAGPPRFLSTQTFPSGPRIQNSSFAELLYAARWTVYQESAICEWR